MAPSRLFVTSPVDTQEGWRVRPGRVPVLIHTGGYPAPPGGLVCWGPLWPLADRVLFNTQSTVLTSPSQHKAHRACGTTPCIWFYWSDALRPKPCWHAQFHCSIIYRLRKGLQHRGQIAGSTGQHFASSDGRSNAGVWDSFASVISFTSLSLVIFWAWLCFVKW